MRIDEDYREIRNNRNQPNVFYKLRFFDFIKMLVVVSLNLKIIYDKMNICFFFVC